LINLDIFLDYQVLNKASVMFDEESRNGVHKRLVLFVTTRSDSSPQEIQAAVKRLTDAGVGVTVVAIGNNAATLELETVTQKEKILLVDPSDPAQTSASSIIEIVIKSMLCN
jgi:ABC-type branched-subunit amino acid transport system substrate-binding protein